MRKVLPALFLFIFATSFKLSAQSCFNVAAGNDTTISCLQQCLALKARIPNIKSTEDYQVISIPYNPYPYVTTAPPFLHPCLTPITGQDDKYVDTSYIPFNFCFYGLVTNKFVISTNGLITFDLFNALHGSNYTVNQQIPYIGSGDSGTGVCPIPDGNALYPKLSIMGAFHDIYPDINDTANYKIEARVEGTAPCRKFVLSFFNIRLYNCLTLRSTFEIVLHEGTGLIDVFVKDKPFCSAANSNTIIGIQKDGLQFGPFTSPPGRNLFTQAITNEAWRFVPNGSTSLLDSVALYKNGAWFAPGTTVDLGNGELEATFNICQSEDSMSYVVRAFYRQCDNSLIQTEGSDTMIVYKTLNPVIANVDNVLCNGTATGKITVTAPLDANIVYSINGGTTWQASPVFNVPAGNYTVQAKLITSLCGGSTNVTVTEPAILTSIAVPSFATCPNNDGSIAITAAGGTMPYQYSINNGINYQAGNVFSNLPAGNYNNIRVKDANDCISNASAVVVLNDTMRLELGPDSIICFGSKITLLPQTNPQTDTFKWTPAAGLDYDTAKNPIASPTDTTKYYLTAKWGVCQRRDSITINILHKPFVDAGKDTTICYKTNALLVGSASNLSGSVNYAWSPPDSLNTPNAAITIARIDTTRKFILTVTDNYGCNFSVSDSVWVTMMPLLVVFAGNDTNAIINRPHQLLASGGTNYVWSPVGPLNNPFIANPLAILNADTYFRVVVTDAIGCTDDDTVFIKVYEGPMYYVPNAFTPNGDGTNDIFRPIPVGIQSTEYFRVFNRYGELMYQTNKWLEGWDGTIKGKKAASGTYAWMIKGVDKNGKVVEMKGTVILIQ